MTSRLARLGECQSVCGRHSGESMYRLFVNNSGQGFTEYLMILALIALGLTAALVAFEGQLSTALSAVGAGL